MTTQSKADVAEMPKIYIASKTKHASKWILLRERGVNIISTWIDEAAPNDSKDLSDLCQRMIKECNECDAIVVYKDNDGEILKGAFLEMGIALSQQNKLIYLVGEILPNGSAFTHSPKIFIAKTV